MPQMMKRTTRRLLLLAVPAAPLLFVLAWYGINRFAYTLHPVRVIREQTAAFSDLVGEDHTTDSLRVLAWNIAHGRGTVESNWDGGDRDTRLRRLHDIARVILEQNADIVVLNEVDFDSTWSYGVNQAEILAREAGYPYRAEQVNIRLSLPFFHLEFGNALLSRHPITKARWIPYPALSSLENLFAGGKQGLLGSIHLPPTPTAVGTRSPVGDAPGSIISIVAVHLEHRSELVRTETAGALLEITSDLDTPVLFAGDFNSTRPGFPQSQRAPDGKTALQVLIENGRFQSQPHQEPGPDDFTFRVPHPGRVIDWILIPESWTFLTYEAPAVELSDHRPVLAEIQSPRESRTALRSFGLP